MQEAAGKSCLCIENTLHSVMVETPNRGVNDSGTFALPGLKNPEGFRRLVMALKGKTGTSAAVPATIAEVMDRAVADGGNTENVATLLREIRDELRQHNEVLQGLNPNSRHLSPSAPPGESGFMS